MHATMRLAGGGGVSTIDRAMTDAALRRCVLFRRVTPGDLDRCTAELAHRHYRRGEVIFHAGDSADALHIVAKGSVKVELPSPQGDEPAILARIDEGGYFGELALLDGDARSATVVALEPTETLVLDRLRFERLLADLPTLRSCLLASLALHDPQTDKLVFRVVAGAAGTGALGLEIRADEGIAGYVFRTGQPLAVADVAADPRFGRAAAEASGYVPRSILAVPLIDDAGSIGVLEAIDKRDGSTFGLRDLDLASVLARQATIAIRASRVERDATTLLRTALRGVAEGADADAALETGLAAVAGGDEDEDGFWPLVDVLARVRAASPEQLALVTELIEVLARRAGTSRGHGGYR
jgi:GAF domain-containing protein